MEPGGSEALFANAGRPAATGGLPPATAQTRQHSHRHFPTREDLRAVASEWIGDRLFGHQLPDRIQDLTASLRVNFANFDEHPNLVRAMALSWPAISCARRVASAVLNAKGGRCSR